MIKRKMNQQTNQSPYDFILNEEKKLKHTSGGKSNGMQRRIIIFAAGLIGLIAVVIIIAGMLGGGETTGERLVSIASKQTEIIRVATLGTSDARGAAAQNYAVNVKATIQTDLLATQTLMKKQNVEADPAIIAAGKNPKHDQTLTIAGQSNQYDEAFTKLIKTLLTSYKNELQAAYQETNSKSAKAELRTLYDHSSALIGQNE